MPTLNIFAINRTIVNRKDTMEMINAICSNQITFLSEINLEIIRILMKLIKTPT